MDAIDVEALVRADINLLVAFEAMMQERQQMVPTPRAVAMMERIRSALREIRGVLEASLPVNLGTG